MEEKKFVEEWVLSGACAMSNELVLLRLDRWLVGDLAKLVMQFVGKVSFSLKLALMHPVRDRYYTHETQFYTESDSSLSNPKTITFIPIQHIEWDVIPLWTFHSVMAGPNCGHVTEPHRVSAILMEIPEMHIDRRKLKHAAVPARNKRKRSDTPISGVKYSIPIPGIDGGNVNIAMQVAHNEFTMKRKTTFRIRSIEMPRSRWLAICSSAHPSSNQF